MLIIKIILNYVNVITLYGFIYCNFSDMFILS